MHSVPIQKELYVLTLFKECVYDIGKPVCLAPALSTPLFLWFQDIDIKQSTPITTDYSLNMIRIICRTISDFYPELKTMQYKKNKPVWSELEGWWMGAGEGVGRLRFLVGTSGMKNGINEKTGKVEYSMGLHIYAIGRLLVTPDQAKIMRLAELDNLERYLGKRRPEDGFNLWEDVIDVGVYKGKGGTVLILF